MSIEEILSLGLTLVAGIGASCRWLLGQITRGDAMLETKIATFQGRTDLEITTLREEIGRDFLRTRIFEISQNNTDRRLESIETKLDKIPASLDRQSERLIAVLKETRL